MGNRWWEYFTKEPAVAVNERSEDRRVFARFHVEFPVKILEPGGSREGSGWAVDVGARGIGFLTNQSLALKQPVDMWLEIPDDHDPLYARGKVAWSEPLGGAEYRVGVNFDRVDFMGLGRTLRAKLAAREKN